MLTVRTGTRYALPVIFRSGQINWSARVAPDAEGTIFSAAGHGLRFFTLLEADYISPIRRIRWSDILPMSHTVPVMIKANTRAMAA